MSNPVCTNCNTNCVGDDGCGRDPSVCAQCEQALAAKAIAALRFSSRLDPVSDQHRVIEIRQLEDVARPDYYVTGENAPRVIALFCLGQLAGIGLIADDEAEMIAQRIGNIPESESLPWAPLPLEPSTATGVLA